MQESVVLNLKNPESYKKKGVKIYDTIYVVGSLKGEIEHQQNNVKEMSEKLVDYKRNLESSEKFKRMGFEGKSVYSHDSIWYFSTKRNIERINKRIDSLNQLVIGEGSKMTIKYILIGVTYSGTNSFNAIVQSEKKISYSPLTKNKWILDWRF